MKELPLNLLMSHMPQKGSSAWSFLLTKALCQLNNNGNKGKVSITFSNLRTVLFPAYSWKWSVKPALLNSQGLVICNSGVLQQAAWHAAAVDRSPWQRPDSCTCAAACEGNAGHGGVVLLLAVLWHGLSVALQGWIPGLWRWQCLCICMSVGLWQG